MSPRPVRNSHRQRCASRSASRGAESATSGRTCFVLPLSGRCKRLVVGRKQSQGPTGRHWRGPRRRSRKGRTRKRALAVSLVARKAEGSAGTLKNPPSVGVNALADKTSKKSTTVANKGAVERVAAKAPKPRTTAPKSVPQGRKAGHLAGGNPEIAKADGNAPVQDSHRGHAGLERDVGAASTRSSCARPRRAQGSQVELALLSHRGAARAGFLNFHSFHEVPQSRLLPRTSLHPLPPASPSTRMCATSISTRTTNSSGAQLAG